MLSVRSPSGDLALADAVTLADRQAERVAGPAAGLSGGGWTSSSSLGYRIGEIFGGLASAALLCWLLSYWITPRWRERAAVRRAAAAHAANGGDGAYPPPPRGAPDAGWLPNPLHVNEELFWNGREWAGRRRWMHGTGSVVRAGQGALTPTPTPYSVTGPEQAPLTCNRLAALLKYATRRLHESESTSTTDVMPDMDAVFRALGDPGRRRLLDR